MGVWEQLLQVDESQREDGRLYFRYAGWRDETRKAEGRGQYRFRRPDGGEIVADLLNDHIVKVPPGRINNRVVIRAESNPVRQWVHHLPTDTWVPLLDYDGPTSELERESVPIDVMAEYIRPAIERFIARTHASGRWGDRTGTTLNLQVGASSDDALESESSGAVVINNTTGVFVYDRSTAARFFGGFRWTGASAIQGATINSASVQCQFTGFRDDMRANIYGDDVDSSSTFTTTTNDITNRTQTTASVDWTADNLGLDTWVTSPDLTTIVQELADRSGFGGAISLLWIPKNVGTKEARVTSYDQDTSLAAKLDIDYTAAAGGAPDSYLTLLGVG